jgi:hypothetical protein
MTYGDEIRRTDQYLDELGRTTFAAAVREALTGPPDPTRMIAAGFVAFREDIDSEPIDMKGLPCTPA